jgi:hypothetical protein
MNTTRTRNVVLLLLAFAVFLPGGVLGADGISTVVAVKGAARIEREKAAFDAKVKDPLLIVDTVSTMEASRIKMLFRDDSVLTLGEKSRVSIKEYVHKSGEPGRSVFNLLDGNLKAVVGKTKFEVHTATAVAAARGTVIQFETGVRDGKKFTLILVQEGEVFVTSASPGVNGGVTLTRGKSIFVFDGEPLSSPALDDGELAARLADATDVTQAEIAVPSPDRNGGLPHGTGGRQGRIGPLSGVADGILSPSDGLSPSPDAHIRQQPGVASGLNTPVNFNLNFR